MVLSYHPSDYGPSEEDFSVTFQVALTASDGWILASDTLETRGAIQGGIRNTLHTKKITHDPATNTVYTCCGDGLSRQIGAAVVRDFHDNHNGPAWSSPASTEARLIEISERLWREEKVSRRRNPDSRVFREVIFVFGGILPFWGLEIGKKSMAGQIYDKLATGDRSNSAKFLIEQYYQYEPLKPVSQLIFLAAHTVLMAHARNPTGVDGLEIVYREGCGDVVELGSASPEIAHLKKLSSEFDNEIRQRL